MLISNIDLKCLSNDCAIDYNFDAIMGKNAVNIGHHYFHNEDLSEAKFLHLRTHFDFVQTIKIKRTATMKWLNAFLCIALTAGANGGYEVLPTVTVQNVGHWIRMVSRVYRQLEK